VVFCDGTFVAGALADAPPAIVKETPAAPNTKAVLRRFRLELCFVRATVGLHVRAFEESGMFSRAAALVK
jgi:hypothetical protein